MSSEQAAQSADRSSRSSELASGSEMTRHGELIRLVTRLLVAQAITLAAVGLPFSRRHLPSIMITIGMTLAVAALALLARSGAKSAWFAAVIFDAVFFLFGLWRFMVARYVGGTLFALITVGALLHPAVARAFGVRSGREGAQPAPAPVQAAGGSAPDAFGEETPVG